MFCLLFPRVHSFGVSVDVLYPRKKELYSKWRHRFAHQQQQSSASNSVHSVSGGSAQNNRLPPLYCVSITLLSYGSQLLIHVIASWQAQVKCFNYKRCFVRNSDSMSCQSPGWGVCGQRGLLFSRYITGFDNGELAVIYCCLYCCCRRDILLPTVCLRSVVLFFFFYGLNFCVERFRGCKAGRTARAQIV